MRCGADLRLSFGCYRTGRMTIGKQTTSQITNVTLDTNCIIDLEDEGDVAPYLRALIRMHEEERINLRVVAISASERKPGGERATSFAEFQERPAAVGLGNAEILRPILYWGVGFWNWSVWGDEEKADLERRIHDVLFPHVEFRYSDFCKARGVDANSGEGDPRWLNAKCDVLAMWSHIHYTGGIFVARDINLRKKTKKAALVDLGAGDILAPQGAVERLANCANLA